MPVLNAGTQCWLLSMLVYFWYICWLLYAGDTRGVDAGTLSQEVSPRGDPVIAYYIAY